MSASSEYVSSARQDYGPPTSSESFFDNVLEHKLTENMSVPSIRTPVLRTVSLSSSEVDPEPDSTENIAHSSQNKFDKEVEFHISEKCDGDMSMDSLSGIVRIENATIDNVGNITYPILEDPDDINESSFIDNANTTLIQAPMSTAMVQNVSKIPQNFTINVDASVSNLTTLTNVPQDISANSQTLWLPTILATSDTKNDKEDNTQTGVSQIIISSDNYMASEGSQTIHRHSNAATETNYINKPKSSKVQILSNITLPKSTNFSSQYLTQNKDITAPVYGTQNQVYKVNTNVVSQKHFNSSVISTKTPKSQSLIGSTMSSTVINSPVKNVSYSHSFTKGSNSSRASNKVNNGANLNAMVAASSVNTQCHVLSRVVSGPNKLSVHSGRKNVNAVKGSKTTNLSGNQKQSRAIKIIQQTGSTKADTKNWQTANLTTYKSQQQATYGVVGVIDSNNSKIITKVGNPAVKNQPAMSLHKTAAKGERLVLQSPCGPVLLSTAPMSTSLAKGPHYAQAGTGANLRYVHTYGADSSMSQMSANQQLTAQILQSLSQPKLMLPQPLPNQNHMFPLTLREPDPVSSDVKFEMENRRIVFGDPSILLTAEDIPGVEERPNLVQELKRYSFEALALVMLDHTYACPSQKDSVVSSPGPAIPTPCLSPPPAPSSPAPCVTPPAPQTLDVPPLPTTSASTVAVPVITYKPLEAPQEDDAGSVISSAEEERHPEDRGGSDTETAPEGEDEGKTRCVCEFTHDDGYMICCDRCGEWQHVDCMGIDRQNIPDSYMCELCDPRPIDRRHARVIQLRKREELHALGASDSDSSGGGPIAGPRRRRLLTVTTYCDTSGVVPPPPAPPPLPPQPTATLATLALSKRGPKRHKKPDVVRKTNKRKLTEKRVKRKKEMMINKSKYNSTVNNQSHWQDTYESAMTNHYSPELRAKIMKYSSKLGSSPNMASAINAHYCTTVPHAGGKILIATKDLKESTPVIEMRGKYMLSTQHRPLLQSSGRTACQKPGPFVFFYRLPKDNIQICIDTRTYGNEARFVRRSCKPNAELQHCIIKGTLHVYLVTIGVIQSNTEITVGHDSNGSKQPCACGNPKHCKINGLSPTATRKSLDYAPREKRNRNRCSSSSSPASPPPMISLFANLIKENPPIPLPQIKSPIKTEVPILSPPIEPPLFKLNPTTEKTEVEVKEEEKPQIDLLAKEELQPEIDEPDSAKAPEKPEEIIPKEEIKEEEKPEPIKMEELKDMNETETIKAIITPKKEEPIFSDEQKPQLEKMAMFRENKVKDENKPVLREMRAKSACHDRSSRSSRTTCVNQDSLDDKTDDSQDKLPTTKKDKDKKKMTREERKMEAIMKAFERMEKAEQRKQEVKERQKRRESDPHPNADKDDDDDLPATGMKRRKRRKGRPRTTSQSNRRRLNSADSDIMTSGDESHVVSPRINTAPPSSIETRRNTHNDIGLSSACLLVEAAVGSVESAFKLPKTKKTMANEWLGRSPDRTPSPYQSPYRPSLVSAPSLESLVRVASTMIGDLSGGHSEAEPEDPLSPPRTPCRDRSRPPKKAKRITRSTPPTEIAEVVPAALPQHSAKKRWLRQAISEESDSPIPESPPNEMVTPLKKRRLARESVSHEQNTVPCNDYPSPNQTIDDSPVKDNRQSNFQSKVRNIMDSLYGRDRTQSDSGPGSDDQCNMEHDVLNVDLKRVHDTENLRRIIGVPDAKDEMPSITRVEDIKTNNNLGESDDNTYNKVVPMEIDTSIIPTPQIKEDHSKTSPKLPSSQPQSADTSGNSSPQRDEMDDIQKKIHSFHTENIMILKSRNKKPPKEKRKKVNLNFDLNMVDDQISVQLRTENEVNGDIHDDVKDCNLETIPLLAIESIPLPAPESIPLPEDAIPLPVVPSIEAMPLPEAIPLPEEPMASVWPTSISTEKDHTLKDKTSVLDNSTVPFTSKFSSSGLFSGIFSNMSQTFNMENQINENVPNMQIIQSAIEKTTSLEKSIFDKDSINQEDELKNVQEILSRVNNMDSNNSLLLSGVLKSSDQESLPGSLLSTSPKLGKSYCPRSNDPRLNPPPAEKPKPIRRKLSITEYRKRHKGATTSESSPRGEGSESTSQGEWAADELSPLRLEAAAAAAAQDLEQRLHRALCTTNTPKATVFDAQPTASERQRENLSSRLRREFGLALPEDEDARSPADPSELASTPADVKRCER